MEHDGVDLGALGWVAGWLVAVVVLFTAALRLPLETRLARWQEWFYSIAVIFAAIGVWILANVAITLHDAHFDLTREKVCHRTPPQCGRRRARPRG
jgi:membrane associated rhomboid family serine protease